METLRILEFQTVVLTGGTKQQFSKNGTKQLPITQGRLMKTTRKIQSVTGTTSIVP